MIYLDAERIDPLAPATIEVFALVAWFYNLSAWLVRILCPGAVLLLALLIIIKRTTDPNEKK
jgi:hypothetical protein